MTVLGARPMSIAAMRVMTAIGDEARRVGIVVPGRSRNVASRTASGDVRRRTMRGTESERRDGVRAMPVMLVVRTVMRRRKGQAGTRRTVRRVGQERASDTMLEIAR